MSKREFQSTLPQLRASLQLARQEKIKSPRTVVDDLQHKLLEAKRDAPEFWQTVSEFINYRSFDFSSEQTLYLSNANLPNCTSSTPRPFTVTEVGPIGDVRKFTNPYYENCMFTLDSSEDDEKINSMIEDGYPIIEFRQCLIVYHGGPFTLITYVIRPNVPAIALTGKGKGTTIDFNGPALWFTKCQFEFSVSHQPSKPAEELMQILLAQNGTSLALPLRNPKSTEPPTHN